MSTGAGFKYCRTTEYEPGSARSPQRLGRSPTAHHRGARGRPGVGLIFLLQGLWQGFQLQISAYEDNVGADLFIAQSGKTSSATPQ